MAYCQFWFLTLWFIYGQNFKLLCWHRTFLELPRWWGWEWRGTVYVWWGGGGGWGRGTCGGGRGLAIIKGRGVMPDRDTSPLSRHDWDIHILKILPPKNLNFQIKNSDIFHISAQNIDCGYSIEPPQQGGSNEYPQCMFLSRNKKNNDYPCKPQFYYIKVRFKGVNIT